MDKNNIKRCGDVLKNSKFGIVGGAVRQMRYCQMHKDYLYLNPCRNCLNKKRNIR